jgi:DNA-binding transcriptional MocR family regulator
MCLPAVGQAWLTRLARSAELYAIPDDYEDFIDYDTAETLETVRRQTVSTTLFPGLRTAADSTLLVARSSARRT